MSTFVKPIVLGLGLVAGIALSAQAQTVPATPGPSVAALPPTDQGPRTASHNFVQGDRPVAVAPSGAYIGPAPGASTGAMPPHYEKSADWDQNTSLHPYTSGQGPKAH
jgi:hypothetical protein